MEFLLKDLEDLLKKHNAAIVRSASVDHELVIVKIEAGKSLEATFSEEITESELEFKRYALSERL